MAHKFGSRGGHVLRVTAGGNAVYGAPADRKPPEAHAKLRQALKGVAEVVGGVAAAGLLGAAAGKTARVAAKVEASARAGGVTKIAKFAIRSQFVQKFLDVSHDTLRFAAGSAGTFAIDKGLNDTLDATGTKNTATGIAAIGAAAKASHLVTRASEGMHLSPTAAIALRNAIKKMGKPIKRPF